MYCTGGIRCEKASAYMLHNGFKKVFHLEGGIINYVSNVKAAGIENKFKGKNFVFDDRLGEKVGEEIISNCHQCGAPCDSHIRKFLMPLRQSTCIVSKFHRKDAQYS